MPDVVIVGGGIGGLTATACLTQAGLHVQVLEQAHQFGEVGAGVQLGPNAPGYWDGSGSVMRCATWVFVPLPSD